MLRFHPVRNSIPGAERLENLMHTQPSVGPQRAVDLFPLVRVDTNIYDLQEPAV